MRTSKYRVIIYSLFACLLIGVISILHTSKVRALEDTYFITLNDDYSGSFYGNFISFWDYDSDGVDGSDIYEVYGSDYGYLLYNLGSDIPLLKTILVNLNGYYVDFNNNKILADYTINDVDGGIIFESGFLYQDLSSAGSTELDSIQLPYKCLSTLSDTYDTELAYLNISDNPVKGEGFIYYVVRFRNQYFVDNVEGQAYYRPQFLFTDLDIDWDSQYQYDLGYSNGYDDGNSQGYDSGYNAGYNAGYNYALSQDLGDYNNVLQIAWNGAATFLNTRVFGNMTILHLILIPLTLGVLIIIIKLVRG